MKKVSVVVDMQNDFINGSLANPMDKQSCTTLQNT